MTGEKTEAPTPQKLRQARKRGDVAKSKDLTSAALLAVTAVGIAVWLPGAAQQLCDGTRDALRAAVESEATTSPLQLRLACVASAEQGASVVTPLLVVLALAAAAVAFAQVGGLFSTEPMKLNFERMHPAKGLKRMFFSTEAWVEFAKSTFKALGIGLLCWVLVDRRTADLIGLAQIPPEEGAGILGGITASVLTAVAIALLVLGFVDWLFQRWSHRKKLRMSKDEVRRERRQEEGSPEHKSARRRSHREIAEQGMVEQARDADLVTLNPTHIACALRYDPSRDDAPRILAVGRGAVAARIRDIAREERIAVLRQVALTRALAKLEPGTEIPPELYEAAMTALEFAEQLILARGETPRWRNTPAPPPISPHSPSQASTERSP